MLTDPTKKQPDTPAFALFVIARKGHVVRRFGTPHAIGYRHTPDTGTPAVVDRNGRITDPAKMTAPAKHEWDEETIHALTADEYEKHRREYDAEIFDEETNPDGGLMRSTHEAWEKQRTARRKADSEAREKRESEAKKAAQTAAATAGEGR